MAGCRRPEANQPSTITETIAPAAPQTAPTGTEAMTQTVDIEDSRSEAEGGVITSPPPAKTTTSTTKTKTTTKGKTKRQ